MPPDRPRRYAVLPARGTLLVSTDMHGNGDDFRALRGVFADAARRDPDTHWVVLGDSVHAPSAAARAEAPALYDYPDESWAIVAGLAALQRAHPGRVHYVLGNHDYGHIGGPRTRKFHDDEVAHLEGTLAPDARAALRAFFAAGLLAVVAPCGALLTHGSPDDALRALADLDAIDLPPAPGDDYGCRVLRSFLTAYGQPADVTARLLATVARDAPPPTMVIHGHDRDEHGWFVEGGNQLCPVLFGALREHKRYVRLDLAARYAAVAALRDGVEILRLYPG